MVAKRKGLWNVLDKFFFVIRFESKFEKNLSFLFNNSKCFKGIRKG